jgi:hypothetical protein
MLTLPNRAMIWQTAQVGFSARRAAGGAAWTVVRVLMNAADFLPRLKHDDQRFRASIPADQSLRHRANGDLQIGRADERRRPALAVIACR